MAPTSLVKRLRQKLAKGLRKLLNCDPSSHHDDEAEFVRTLMKDRAVLEKACLLSLTHSLALHLLTHLTGPSGLPCASTTARKHVEIRFSCVHETAEIRIQPAAVQHSVCLTSPLIFTSQLTFIQRDSGVS